MSNVIPFSSSGTLPGSDGVLVLVLAGGRGSRLNGLTDWRAKPAVFFGGHYRLIDFVLSNCINSGFTNIGIVTQYKSHSLNMHVQKGWQIYNPDGSPSLELLPAQQRTNESMWYSGTADAIYQNLDIIRSHNPKYVMVLSGDHIYKMDYSLMFKQHVKSGAKLTISSTNIPAEDASRFGVLVNGENNLVNSFIEKPVTLPEEYQDSDTVTASMGNYIFNSDYLYDQLIRDHQSSTTENDFGKNLIPGMIKSGDVYSYNFAQDSLSNNGYWKDVGTIDSYYESTMELTGPVPAFDLYSDYWPIRTYQQQFPPAKFVQDERGISGSVENSIISAGCILSGSSINNSVLSPNVVVGSDSVVKDSVIFPDVEIGKNCCITKAIVDRGCVIPDGTVISAEENTSHYNHITDSGIVLLTRDGCMSLNDQQQVKAA